VSFDIVLPLIGYALLKARRPRVTVCGTLIAAGLVWTAAGVTRGWPPEVTWTLPTYIGVLTCGVAAAVAAQRRPPRLVGAAGVLIVLANSWWHSSGTGTLGHIVGDLPAGIGFALILWALAYRESRVLASKPVVWLGTVSYGVYLWHMPVLYWLGLNERLPERFLPENRATVRRFSYLPFGAGPRVCIGQSFSLQEAVVVLAHIARAARFTLADDHAPVVPLHRVTLRPEHGLHMTVHPRG
jgi:peptidoglycan/LPS O-acetylase OafA/YrhL